MEMQKGKRYTKKEIVAYFVDEIKRAMLQSTNAPLQDNVDVINKVISQKWQICKKVAALCIVLASPIKVNQANGFIDIDLAPTDECVKLEIRRKAKRILKRKGYDKLKISDLDVYSVKEIAV